MQRKTKKEMSKNVVRMLLYSVPTVLISTWSTLIFLVPVPVFLQVNIEKHGQKRQACPGLWWEPWRRIQHGFSGWGIPRPQVFLCEVCASLPLR